MEDKISIRGFANSSGTILVDTAIWKNLPGVNALAYFASPLVTKTESLITFPPDFGDNDLDKSYNWDSDYNGMTNNVDKSIK